MMIPRIETLAPKRLIGLNLQMSLVDNKTGELWRSFMMKRKTILSSIGDELYSIQLYPAHTDWNRFDPNLNFTKWAAVEVATTAPIPEGFKEFNLLGGCYAVFDYKGSSNEAQKVFSFIFGEWLPNSGFSIDNRPHFEVLGPKYKNGDPTSEEEIWIPIKS
jgi:AraC family transcriptional regulator